jgi:hypothetical protein
VRARDVAALRARLAPTARDGTSSAPLLDWLGSGAARRVRVEEPALGTAVHQGDAVRVQARLTLRDRRQLRQLPVVLTLRHDASGWHVVTAELLTRFAP